jgi:TonB family protein
MHLRLLSLLILIFLPFLSSAQHDTAYFKRLQRVFTMQEADYYRLPLIKEGDKYKVQEYHINGQLKTEGYSLTFDSLIWDGPYTSYYSNGNKENTGSYMNGHKVANWKCYREDVPKPWAVISYTTSEDTTEILTSFYKSGKVKRIEYRRKDKDPAGICYNEDGAEIKFTPFDKMPEYNGDINTFLDATLSYPVQAREEGYQGRILVRFTVSEKGSTDNVEVVNPSAHPSLMKESVRVVKLTNGNWKPGMQDDVPVKVYFTLPIMFKLE